MMTGQVLEGRDHWNTDKRAWNQLHGGWGKRTQMYSGGPTAPMSKKEWTNLRGSWGKREPAEQGSSVYQTSK